MQLLSTESRSLQLLSTESRSSPLLYLISSIYNAISTLLFIAGVEKVFFGTNPYKIKNMSKQIKKSAEWTLKKEKRNSEGEYDNEI